LPKLDLLEDSLSAELGFVIRIKDWNALLQLVNYNRHTLAAFKNEFRHEIFDLTAHAEQLRNAKNEFAADPSVYVFLQYENKERLSKGGLVIPVVDALIYWTLRETDPDKAVMLSRAEIKTRIQGLFPGAASNLLPSVDDRLKLLATKGGGGEQRVRHYPKEDSFCLPYNMRSELAAKSAEEAALFSSVRESLIDRAKTTGAASPAQVALVCERAIYRYFHDQGLILAAFLEKRLDGISINDQVVEAELKAVIGEGEIGDQKSYAAALSILRIVFYTPNEVEAVFLKRLSRTSLLLFSLKHCPSLIEYFNQLSGEFRLLVGTDILVKALSETFLPAEDRHVTNLLKVARAFGAHLILTEPVLRELFTHLHAAYLEFRNHYAASEQYITAALASQCDRILIRTYFYAKLFRKQVTGWKAFINRFVDPDELERKSEKGAMGLQGFICKTFDLEFMTKEETSSGVDADATKRLATDLNQRYAQKNEMLGENDAQMVLAVYAQRRSHKEQQKYDGFGLRTWWLTKETRVLKYTSTIVRESGGVPYIMRPEFLLNFLTLSPKGEEVDAAVLELLPSHVGLQIGQHLPENHMHQILDEIDTWKELSPERVTVIISDAVDRLKFDQFKRYQSNLDLNGHEETRQFIQTLKAAKSK
jgi:hypothetical protein